MSKRVKVGKSGVFITVDGSTAIDEAGLIDALSKAVGKYPGVHGASIVDADGRPAGEVSVSSNSVSKVFNLRDKNINPAGVLLIELPKKQLTLMIKVFAAAIREMPVNEPAWDGTFEIEV